MTLKFTVILLGDRALIHSTQETQVASELFMMMLNAALSFKPKAPYPVNNSCRVKMLDTTEHLVQ